MYLISVILLLWSHPPMLVSSTSPSPQTAPPQKYRDLFPHPTRNEFILIDRTLNISNRVVVVGAPSCGPCIVLKKDLERMRKQEWESSVVTAPASPAPSSSVSTSPNTEQAVSPEIARFQQSVGSCHITYLSVEEGSEIPFKIAAYPTIIHFTRKGDTWVESSRVEGYLSTSDCSGLTKFFLRK